VTKCKYCGTPAEWVFTEYGWRLHDGAGKHICVARMAGPVAVVYGAARKKKKGKGYFLRWYGPAGARTEAVLVEPPHDPDTPAGFYAEPTLKHWSTL
jgi:hypothetical protein